MIKSLQVEGLNGNKDYCLNFHSDLNILTGRNGSGKTTLLKLLWYLITPLRRSVFSEIHFRKAKVITDKFSLEVSRSNDADEIQLTHWRCNTCQGDKLKKDITIPLDGGLRRIDYEHLESVCALLHNYEDKSLFFPTFRRIEGGFGTPSRRYRPYPGRIYRNDSMALSEAMEEFASAVSDDQHKLVASLSTNDIVQFLMGEYNSVTEETKRQYIEFSKRIKSLLTNKPTNGGSRALIKALKDSLAEVEDKANTLMRPFEILSELVKEVFVDKEIQVSSSLSLGEASKALNSDALSAGEKQMFSFLSYNAFVHDSIILIDEPELSLHVDWQRILFSKLLEQETTNQFIVTTHSPFIYTQYPEKEFFLDSDRGCNQNFGK